jgi:hypothetical protein
MVMWFAPPTTDLEPPVGLTGDYFRTPILRHILAAKKAVSAICADTTIGVASFNTGIHRVRRQSLVSTKSLIPRFTLDLFPPRLSVASTG